MTARGAAGRCPPTQGLGAPGESKSWEEMTPSLSQTWLGPRLLLTCLLVSTSVTEAVPEYCSHLIRDGHLTILQQLIDSQMQTSCKIPFEFVDQNQLNDRVCYLKKAFLLVQDIMEDTLRFKDNTPNANATMQLQELSIRLKSCFTKDDEEQDKACVRTFTETPLQLLEKIKNVFNETKNLLTNNWKVFSKNCSDSFAKCSSHDVVTKPDCNCLYPKATPSSDLASVSLRQPLTPSAVPLAGLTGADSEGTEDGSFLPSEQPLHAVDPGSAKQRPPRSTCQNFESPETPGHGRQHVQHSDPQLPGFVFHLLVPSIILVLLAVGGLLFYRWKRRSHRELQTVDSPMEQPEDSPLTQDGERQVELPV
ncbi:macrophage colony-stimulating factor 1 isoform X5 [Elephas maximus indicus]|uniref:macrophage colony-stimulating factor 1 isoform X5 n=1 Tax=Elephas maximus indicus TaxID=99487 RepID=UPI0021169D86|nr:macrophage colony-stimulating factor 1 isoform X5 [Elephas maximus indicus]